MTTPTTAAHGDHLRVHPLPRPDRRREPSADPGRELVLAPGVFAHAGDPMTDDDKQRLDALHLTKIDLACWV